MFIQNLSKRERRIALTTIVIAVVALTHNFILEPIRERWMRFDEEIDSKVNRLRKNTEIVSIYNLLETRYEKLSKYAKSTKKEEEEVAAILSEIEAISRTNSAAIENIKPLGVKNRGTYKEVLIEASLDAQISQLSKFLYDLENSQNMIVKVKRFTLFSKANQPNILKCTLLVSKLLID
ncbi:MAG: hypothetical protein A2987_02240 [Omnitrophica bacterium RIFCSPLOWO2_01_FULL_45_10]|nr:MAG: hypothetical protein A2987_02240 [Omnitrophica bacterium RIFCSPLOWO2_01_FULL_45_10]